MMNQAQLQLLRRMADQGRVASMDVALGANVLAGLLDALAAAQARAERAEGLAKHVIRVFGDQTNPSMAIRALVVHARAALEASE
jgi:hypothetical protein